MAILIQRSQHCVSDCVALPGDSVCYLRCPPGSSLDSSDDPALYDEAVFPSSPILTEASLKLPAAGA
jgi:hypothetical protein